MKKVFAFILVLCMVLSCMPAFAADGCQCGESSTGTTYTSNGDGTHWRRCVTCGKYTYLEGKTQWDCTYVTKYDENNHWEECSECGYVKPDTTVAHTLAYYNDKDYQIDHCKKCTKCDYNDRNWERCTENGVQFPRFASEFCGSKTCDVCRTTITGTATDKHQYVLKNGKSVCAFCGAEKAACTHAGTVVFGKAVTCAEDGLTDGVYCSTCEVWLVPQQTIKANGHLAATEEIIREATCAADGLKHVKCTACGFDEYEDISSTTAHTLVYVGYEKNCIDCYEPTCEANGSVLYACSNPDCDYTEHKAVEKLGHDYTKKVYYNVNDAGQESAATETDCTKDVYSKIVCSRKGCDSVLASSVKVEAAGKEEHQYTKRKVVTATCNTLGGVQLHCENAGCVAWTWENNESHYYGKTSQDHSNIVEIVVKEGSCTEDRVLRYVCGVCGAQVKSMTDLTETTKDTTIPAVGHTNATMPKNHAEAVNMGWTFVAPTCKDYGYFTSECTVCLGNAKTFYCNVDCTTCKPRAHAAADYIDGEVVVEAICGEKDGACKQVCKYCGAIKVDEDGTPVLKTISKNEHVWVMDAPIYEEPTCSETGKGWMVCSRCGARKFETAIPTVGTCKFETVFVDETCTHGAYSVKMCVYCGAESGTRIWVDNNKQDNLDNHKWVTTDLKPMCSYSGGREIKVCGVCGEEKVVFVGNFLGYDKHKHDKLVIVEKTCTTDGMYYANYCKKCGYIWSEEITIDPAEGHLGEVRDEANDIAQSCVSAAYQAFKCTKCGETYTKKVAGSKPYTAEELKNDPTKHAKYEVVEWVVPATCTESGIGYYGCKACGWKADTAENVAADHTYGDEYEVIVAPTCGEVGYGRKVCLVCGKVDHAFDEIKATGKHTFGRVTHEADKCTETGSVNWECVVCGARDASYKKYRNTTDTTIAVIPAGNHVWGETTKREATCELNAGYRKTCKVCGLEAEVATTEGTKLNHDYVTTTVPATCYVAGSTTTTCLLCGKTTTTAIAPLNHNYSSTDAHHGLVKAKTGHVAATCSTTGYDVYECAEGCGYTEKFVTEKTAANHNWVIDKTIREATCTNNGLAIMHCASCNAAGDQIRVIEAKHNYVFDSVKTAATCTTSGVNNLKCTVCGAKSLEVVAPIGHTLVTEKQEVGCETEEGYLTYCSVCSYKTNFVKTGSKRLGHKYGAKVYVDATCEEASHYEATCERCGKVDCIGMDSTAANYKPAKEHFGAKMIEEFKGTCIEKGYKLYHCELCGKDVKEVNATVNTNGHDWKVTFVYGGGEVSCEKDVYVDKTCSLCGKPERMVKHHLDHEYSGYIVEDDIDYQVCLNCGEMKVVWASSTFKGYKGCTTWNATKNQWEGTHKGLVVNASKDATCTEAGELGHIECTVCGTVIRVGGVIPAHTTKEVAAVEATCTTEGSTAGTFCLVCNKYVVAPQKIAAKGHKWVEVPAQDATATKPGYTAGTQCENCKEWKEGHEEIPVKAASLKRTAVLRKTAELLGERVALLNTDDAITITGELVNGFYPVSTADGTGYIHNSYIAVA